MAWAIILGVTLLLLAIALFSVPQMASGGLSAWRNSRIDPYGPMITPPAHEGPSRSTQVLFGVIRASTSPIRNTWRHWRH